MIKQKFTAIKVKRFLELYYLGLDEKPFHTNFYRNIFSHLCLRNCVKDTVKASAESERHCSHCKIECEIDRNKEWFRCPMRPMWFHENFFYNKKEISQSYQGLCSSNFPFEPITISFLFCFYWKHQITKRFLFSEGYRRKHWTEIG